MTNAQLLVIPAQLLARCHAGYSVSDYLDDAIDTFGSRRGGWNPFRLLSHRIVRDASWHKTRR